MIGVVWRGFREFGRRRKLNQQVDTLRELAALGPLDLVPSSFRPIATTRRAVARDADATGNDPNAATRSVGEVDELRRKGWDAMMKQAELEPAAKADVLRLVHSFDALATETGRDLERMEQSLGARITDIETSLREVEAANADLADCSAAAAADLDQRLTTCTDRVSALDAAQSSSAARIAALNGRLTSAAEQMSELDANMTSCASDLARHDKALDKLGGDQAAQDVLLRTLTQDLEALRASVDAYRLEVARRLSTLDHNIHNLQVWRVALATANVALVLALAYALIG